MKYVIMDCESGGFEGTSLLSFYFGLVDKDFNITNELELFLKPKNGIYAVTAEALMVNKIDLKEHDKHAITYEQGGTLLYEFLNKNTEGGKYKPQPLGHNVYHDIDRISPDLMTKKSWQQFVSYRLLDTGVLGSSLKDAGRIPSDISGSLSSYCQFFEVDHSSAHDAKGDSIMTLNLYKKMIGLIRG